jgi:hypothetical protein
MVFSWRGEIPQKKRVYALDYWFAGYCFICGCPHVHPMNGSGSIEKCWQGGIRAVKTESLEGGEYCE